MAKQIEKIAGKIDVSEDLVGWEDFYFKNYSGKKMAWFYSIGILLGAPTVLIIVYLFSPNFVNETLLTNNAITRVLALAYTILGAIALYIGFETWRDLGNLNFSLKSILKRK